MSKITDLECSIIYSLEILGKKWNAFIITELLIQKKPISFSDLQQSLIGNYQTKISSRVLSDKLSKLEELGVIIRTELRHGNVIYSLTEKGIDFEIVLMALKSWAVKHDAISFELCKNRTCIHKAVEYKEFDKLFTLFDN
ncbi:MAG: helix-turn-helix transcriptional regulator [Candidatus Heimdallarchaeota archaeon]|nr:helix-turn-helix transcriptional regulator [Candidatus Heimdallarchaeota archaeon]